MDIRFPWESVLVEAPPLLPDTVPPPKRRGRRPSATQVVSTDAASSANWLYHHLTISGPAEPLLAFAEMARGSGVVPWTLDFRRIEEDVFNLAAAQPPARRQLTIAGCHILARQFRERVEAHQAKAVALVGRSRACPFDLQGLLPVPASILLLGPTHPHALTWLSENWGVTDSPRQVTERQRPTTGRRLPAEYRVIGYSFFTFKETPHAAIAQLGGRWPTLRFVLHRRSLD